MTLPLEVIHPIVDDASLSWVEKLDRIVYYEKSHGLVGFHATFYSEDGKEIEREKMAHDICMMELACSKGELKDVTNEPVT